MHLSLDMVSFTLVWRTSNEADEVSRERVNTKVFVLHLEYGFSKFEFNVHTDLLTIFLKYRF